MATNSGCPTNTTLERLLSGTISEGEQAQLEQHVGSCDECLRRFEEMAGGGDVVPDVLPASTDEEPFLGTAVAKLIDQLKTESPTRTMQLGQSQASEASLDFLQPALNPGYLGRLGDYEIIEVVGEGGMGMVMKAHDPNLNRFVAIKVLKPELAANATARQRFRGEAQKAAAISHDHVVTIHAVQEIDRLPIIVMEYVSGVSLEKRIDRDGPLKVEEILRIGMQTASGLAAAHAQGVIHRDIKPSNILLENGVERVKITDFGLAQAADDVDITQPGVVCGTIGYMCPEQARGEKIDHRGDLFSLGCVLYAMCTGRSPFRAENIADGIRRICHDDPRPIQEINGDVPDWLAAITEQLVSKDPKHRFQTAHEVAELLGDHLAQLQHPSEVATTGSSLPAADSGRVSNLKRRTIFLASLVGLVVIALAVAAYWRAPGRPSLIATREYDGRVYKLYVVDEAITWDEAERWAVRTGGHLATVTSGDEDQLVLELIDQADCWTVYGETLWGPWIGGVQREGMDAPRAGWRWITGEPFRYSNWHCSRDEGGPEPNEPYRQYARSGVCYVWKEGKRQPMWADLYTSTSQANSFVVEYDKLAADPPNLEPEADDYGALEIDFGLGEYGLQVQVSADEAGFVCTEDGTHTLHLEPGPRMLNLLANKGSRLVRTVSIDVRAGEKESQNFKNLGQLAPVFKPDKSSAIPYTPKDDDSEHLYQVVYAPDEITLEAASRLAREVGGHLVTLTTEAENRFVFDLCDRDVYWYLGGQKLGPWIGAIQPDGSREPRGGWRWVTPEAWNYDGWAKGQPNGHDNKAAFMYRQPAWGDVDRSADFLAYVVEWDKYEPADCIDIGSLGGSETLPQEDDERLPATE